MEKLDWVQERTDVIGNCGSTTLTLILKENKKIKQKIIKLELEKPASLVHGKKTTDHENQGYDNQRWIVSISSQSMDTR